MKKVLVVSSTPRVDGNSEILAKEFARGAEEAGHKVDFVTLRDKKIGYCRACDACRKLGHCVLADDMTALYEKLLAADVIFLATPVYFYSMSAQLKTFIDRLYCIDKRIRADIYLAASMWEDDVEEMERTIEAIRGCTRDCMENCPEKGVIYGVDLGERGAVRGHEEYLLKAYEYGKNC